MSGFVRRFTSFPPIDVITAIEGINIVDLPPPASIGGQNENVVGLIGEFADMTYAVDVSSTGVISTAPKPQEVVSGQDLLNKFGGFDETLGKFGGDCGNGYAEVRNKSFGRLILCSINLCSASGVRMWRQLPTNKSATDPTPITPIAAASVAAGTIFKRVAGPADRLKAGVRVDFSGIEAYETAVDGSVTAVGAAVTQIFVSASGLFTTFVRPDGKVGVELGDVLVLGVLGAAGAQGADADTYRVTAVTDATHIVVQKLDGSSWNWTTGASLAWRLHTGLAADSFGSGSGSGMGSQGSFSVPVRPLTDGAGTGSGAGDGTWATTQAIAPLVAAATPSATTWEPLSGLTGAVGPTTAVAYTAAIQKANAPNHASIDALYSSAFDSFLFDDVPQSEVAHIWPARKSDVIRSMSRGHCLTASAQGGGRTTSVSPQLDITKVTALTTVCGDAAPGVGANRDERNFYHWPPVKTFVPEAVGKSIARADGTIGTDGIMDTTADGWMSCIMGNLAPERNPGESSATTRKCLAPVLGYATNVPDLNINAWQLLRLRGVSGIRMDKTVGPVFQSGITSSLISGQKNINRRKMADYCEDSIGQALKPFTKLPMSEQFKDGVIGQVDDFLTILLSPDNAAAARINGYLLDPKSGNTPATEARGIFVLIIKIRTTPSADFIVLQFEVGEGVLVSSQLAA